MCYHYHFDFEGENWFDPKLIEMKADTDIGSITFFLNVIGTCNIYGSIDNFRSKNFTLNGTKKGNKTSFT